MTWLPNIKGLMLTVAVLATSPSLASAAEGAMCPMLYAPVCGYFESGRRDFSNECVARSAGAKMTVPGKCADQGASLKDQYPWPWPWGKASAAR